MNEELEQVGNLGETTTPEQTADNQNDVEISESTETNVKEQEKTIKDNNETTSKSFTQEQVNDLVRSRIDRERASVYKRYGANDKAGLDDLVGKGYAYDVMKERYDTIKGQVEELTRENAFIENNIDPTKRDDVIAHFKGKEMEFSKEALKNELQTHPEWLKVVEKSDKPITKIEFVSPERGKKVSTDEKGEMAKLFGLERIL